MGRSRAAAVMEFNPEVEAETVKPPPEAGGEGSESLFDASGDARVRIYRRDERTQKWVTHGYMIPTCSEEMVSARFGGGQFRAQLFVPNDAGNLVVKRTRDFYIPGPYKPPTHINTAEEVGPNAPVRDPGANAPPASTVAGLPTGGDDLMQVLKAGIINTLLEMMKSTKEMNTRAPAGPDPIMLEMLRQVSATQQEMMKFMMTVAMKDTGKGEKDTLEMLAKMKEIVSPASNVAVPTDPMKMFNNMLDTFKSFREAAEDVAPSHSDVDPIMGSIPKLVEVVAEQHQMQKNRAQHIVMHPVPGPAGGVAHMPEVSTLPPQPDLAMWQKILRQQSARLVASAAAKHDPDVIAGTAILFAPPNVKEALMIFFHRDEAEIAADTLAEVPAMADHREWLSEFILAAQERLFPEEFSDDDDTPEGEGEDGAK